MTDNLIVISGAFAEVHAPNVARHFSVARMFDASGPCVGHLLDKNFKADVPVLVVVPASTPLLQGRVWSARANILVRADHKDGAKIVRGPDRGTYVAAGASK